MKEFLSKNEIKFDYIDISDSMPSLKAFLKYRDHRSEFVQVKEEGRVGIPCIVINDGEKIFLDKPDLSELL
jgi:glutaredoxin-related protein